MAFTIVPVTPFQQNCSIFWCERTHRAAVIDPGGDAELILDAVKQRHLSVEKILLTHGHLDHVGAAAQLARQLDVPIEGPHIADKFWLDALPQQAAMFGFGVAAPFVPDRWLDQYETTMVGERTLDVRHCPGHTPGHIIFFDSADRLAFVGDVLFNGSIGRTDFPGGDFEQLLKSIREQLFPLGDDVRFVPGHGPMSTFGAERLHNQFVSDKRYG